jgi:hypothetical protein
VTLDREHNEHTSRLKRSLNKVKWSHALMQIFWTAGPVTSLGLIGGYYIGYGTMPSLQLLIYFVSFTVFSGLIGLVAKVVYDGTTGHLKEQSEKDVERVTGKLADLILVARDKVVQGYEGDARQREAALQLLRRVDLTPYGVTIAFSDLTGNRKIGEIMGQVYAYRRIGLQTRVSELYDTYQEIIDDIALSLQEKSPEAAKELKQWFSGKTSGQLKYGVPREKFFLQRVMSAIENNNPYIMTNRDIEEMMILAFELISGREIPTLIFSYSGRWKYADRLNDIEEKRSRYRVAQARGGNRIRALASFLVETKNANADELPEGMNIKELIPKVTKIIDRLAFRLRRTSRNVELTKNELTELADIMGTSIELYQMAYDGYKDSRKRHKELISAEEKWMQLTTRESLKSTLFSMSKHSKGIRIKESVISLNEEERLKVCRHLSWYFDKERVNLKNHFQFMSNENGGGMPARRLAVEIAVALEPHIQLSKPEIQRNINATKAIYLGGLSPEMSSVQKQELGSEMVKETDNGLEIAAIRLAETLVRKYHVELSEEAIDFLKYNYGANRQALKRIANNKVEQNTSYEAEIAIPPMPEETKKEWQYGLSQINKRISKL